jgi:hypothetical protein
MIMSTLKKSYIFIIFAALLMSFLVSFSGSVEAAPCRSLARNQILGINSWNKYLQCDPARDNAITDFAFPEDIWLVVIALVEILMRAAVYIAVGLVIYGGIVFIISQGSPDRIQQAKSTIEQALVGVVIAVLAIFIVNFIGNSVT